MPDGTYITFSRGRVRDPDGGIVIEGVGVLPDRLLPLTVDTVIREASGQDVLLADGSLDRKRLGDIVFDDEEKRHTLNAIVHPLVIESQNNWIRDVEKQDPNGIAVVDAALMIETGGYKRFDKLIVVWCKSALQLKRLMLRDNLSQIDAQKRIDAQMPQDEKKRFADYLIDTSDGFESTRDQTVDIFSQLRRMNT